MSVLAGAPLCARTVKQIVATVKESSPIEHDLPGYNWTLKKLRRWIKTGLRL